MRLLSLKFEKKLPIVKLRLVKMRILIMENVNSSEFISISGEIKEETLQKVEKVEKSQKSFLERLCDSRYESIKDLI